MVLAVTILAAVTCTPVLDVVTPNPGRANFEKYIAIGSGYTAGFNDGALHRQGQLNSYPNMLANQFRMVNGGTFNIPLTPDDIGFNADENIIRPKLELEYRTYCDGNVGLSPVRLGSTPTPGNFDYIGQDHEYHNYGIPGLRVTDLFLGTLSDPNRGNPYYIRFAPDSQNVLFNVLYSKEPTFFTCWLGMDDLMAFAKNGGVGYALTGGEQFATGYNLMINTLVDDSAQGVIANIPDLLKAPFFNSIAIDGLVLSAEQTETFNYMAEIAQVNYLFQEGKKPVAHRRC